ncbi:MAG: hypothetical protein IMW89_19640 [Ktedonobacteraceae bacterium]|nr:hypothetical protein [Ktedonobacteraceae bacterium]
MEQVVPGTLQRLRAADIVRMAGLTVAALGQEYCRPGAVHSTQRDGSRLSGIVEVSHLTGTHTREDGGESGTSNEARRYTVAVDVRGPASWVSSCSCEGKATKLCPHAAALLYTWLARPADFSITPVTSATQETTEPVSEAADGRAATRPAQSAIKSVVVLRDPASSASSVDLLAQMGLSELRNIARECGITSNGMNRQQLVEAIMDLLQQPVAVRRLAMTLEKAQRQLLAAIMLAGGYASDDDLRGLFERFGLGQPDQLQRMLVTLQQKALLFRTSLPHSSQSRMSMAGASIDTGWYIPLEVRAALRVSVPTTVFALEPGETGEAPVVKVSDGKSFLARLLLIARILDGYSLAQESAWPESERGNRGMIAQRFSLARLPGALKSENAVSIPPPQDTPSASLLSLLQQSIGYPLPFLRFAVRLLRLADILYRDDSGLPFLRVLSNIASLLLGPGHEEVMRDLFELWLTHDSYDELYDLQEEGLRVCCRASSLGHPVLRPGELEVENKEARQELLALLARVPPGQWVKFSAFARFVYRLKPLFLQQRQRLFSSPHWWLEREEGRSLKPLILNDWLQAEACYIERLLRGPLYWWGACDLALSRDGQLLAFRLTDLATWLFDGAEVQREVLESDYHALVNSLEIIDGEEIGVACSVKNWPLIELMETFAEAAGVRNGYLRYRLTAGALGAAIGRGQHPECLLAFLRSASTHTERSTHQLIPLLAQLERWIASYGRARIYRGVTLLGTADSTVMRELSATTSLDRQVVRAIQPTLVILRNAGTEQLLDELKRRGHTPLLHEEDEYGAE